MAGAPPRSIEDVIKILIDKLTAAGVKSACPECDDDRTTVKLSRYSFIDDASFSLDSMPSSFPTVVFVCDNCGLIRQFKLPER